MAPPPPDPAPPFDFLKAENTFCHRDFCGTAIFGIGGAEAVEGVSDGARELNEDVEFENGRQSGAKPPTGPSSQLELAVI